MHRPSLDYFPSTVLDVPRPGEDPIDTLQEALAVVSLMLPRPARDETFVLVVDDRRRGIGVARFCTSPDSMAHDVAGFVSSFPAASGAIVVTTRRGRAVCPGDDTVWEKLSTVLGGAGIALLDWVVSGSGGFYCPRVLVDARNPWPGFTRAD